MRTITLHPVSVLVGCALAGLAVLSTGAAQQQHPSMATPTREVRLVGEIPGEWWTHVYVASQPNGTPSYTYTVPSDRQLVVTLASGGGNVLADGQQIGQALIPLEMGSNADRNGTRAVIPAGSVLTAYAGVSATLWGYLEPVH